MSDDTLRALRIRAYPLPPLDSAALTTVIREPCRRAGIAVQEGLAERMVADTGGGESLPLLAFTLEQLADGEWRGGQLTVDRYNAIGGVQGGAAQPGERRDARRPTRVRP